MTLSLFRSREAAVRDREDLIRHAPDKDAERRLLPIIQVLWTGERPHGACGAGVRNGDPFPKRGRNYWTYSFDADAKHLAECGVRKIRG